MNQVVSDFAQERKVLERLGVTSRSSSEQQLREDYNLEKQIHSLQRVLWNLPKRRRFGLAAACPMEERLINEGLNGRN